MNGDQGLFGPGSVTWKVHAHPVLIVGGLRALMIQALHPLAMAGVAQYSDFRADPLRRLRGTARYVHAVTFGDVATARAAAERVKRIHARVEGVDNVTGERFSARDPELLLWVHCAEVHSFLAAVRTYGYSLSRVEQDRYLAEQVMAAELIGVPRAMVPDSVDAYREYFERTRPSLRTGEEAAATIAFVRRPSLPDPLLNALLAPALRTIGQAATALVPRSLRQTAGLPSPGPRELPAAAAVTLASRALLESRRLPLIGGRLETPIRKGLLGVGGLPRAA